MSQSSRPRIKSGPKIPPVIWNGEDLTPVPLAVADKKDFIGSPRPLTMAQSTGDVLGREGSLTKFKAEIQEQFRESVKTSEIYNTKIMQLSHDMLDSTMMSWEKAPTGADNESEESEPEEVKLKKIPQYYYLTLQETETVFLMEMQSCTALKASDEAIAVENDNNRYDFLTSAKGRNRKVVEAEAQTVPTIKKNRESEPEPIKYADDGIFVTNWIMYDDYTALEQEQQNNPEEVHEDNTDHRLFDIEETGNYEAPDPEVQMQMLLENRRFQDALLIIQRLLANNNFNEKQKRYKGLSDPDVFRENIEFKYRLEKLWTFACEETKNKCVVDISLNAETEDVIAVGYGKYYFTDDVKDGVALVWNIKNPKQPERIYKFPVPVMSLKFSNMYPNLLAVGLYNGIIYVIDVTEFNIKIVGESIPFFEPVWCVIWMKQEGEECIFASFGNGCVMRFQLSDSVFLNHNLVYQTTKAIGTVKGLKPFKTCEPKAIEIIRFVECEHIYQHPADPLLFYVTTQEGIMYKCNINYLNQHIDLKRLHRHAINAISFNPFVNKIYISVGNDYWLRFWIDEINDPFEESRISIHNVHDCCWSNSHSTIFLTLREKNIFVWDLQRKLYAPQSKTVNSNNVLNTCIRCIKSGRCVIVGDLIGNVHVYSFEDIPFKPFFQEDLFKQSLYKLLITQPQILRRVKKMDSLSHKPRNFTKYFN